MPGVSEEMAAAERLGYDITSLSRGQNGHASHRKPDPYIPLPTLSIVRTADVAPRQIRWLWEPRIARGKLTLFAGDPGLGKSMLSCALAATVSTGGCWPDNRAKAETGNVILLSAEDAVDDTIRPRLDAAGADCSRVFCAEMVREWDEEGSHCRSFSLEKDVDLLRNGIRQIGGAQLIVIDPISAYLGGTDSHKNADVRAILAPLSELAEETDAAIVVVSHLNKASGSAMYRTVGSIAFVAAARSAWAVVKDQAEPSRRLLLPVKNNLGNDDSGLAYELKTAENGAGFVAWEPGSIKIDVDEALGRPEDSDTSALDDAVQWLESELFQGPVQVKELQTHAKQNGHSWRTVERAKKKLGVMAKKELGPSRRWRWHLPSQAQGRPSENLADLADIPKSPATTDFQQLRQGRQAERTGAPYRCKRCSGEGCALCSERLAGVRGQNEEASNEESN